jgi:type IV pilus assembly protein PilO
MAAVADFARLPTRQKVTIFAVIGLVLGLIYWQFVYKGLEADLQAAQNENTSKQQLDKKLEADIPEYERLRTRMTTLQRIIEENQKALPTEAELPAFFETLNRKVLESGVEVIRSKQGKEEPIETFVKVPIEYEIQGTYVQIKRFFASLLPDSQRRGQVESSEQGIEERERIVSIENLSLTQPVVRNREIRLTAKFTASTYRQEEKKDAAKPAPGAAKGTSPAAAGAAGKGTSPAAAGTPSGAKTQTEQAVDKGDDRNRGASGVDEAKTPSGSTATGVERMKEGK